MFEEQTGSGFCENECIRLPAAAGDAVVVTSAFDPSQMDLLGRADVYCDVRRGAILRANITPAV